MPVSSLPAITATVSTRISGLSLVGKEGGREGEGREEEGEGEMRAKRMRWEGEGRGGRKRRKRRGRGGRGGGREGGDGQVVDVALGQARSEGWWEGPTSLRRGCITSLHT